MADAKGDFAARQALIRARAAWPTIALSEVDFDAHLGRVGADADAVSAHGPDLFLACACTRGDRAALSVFEGLHIAQVGAYVARLGLSAEKLEELRQLVRVKLFTGDRRILRYSGQGPLGAWIRMLSLRVALDEFRLSPRERVVDADILDALAATAPLGEDASLRLAWGARLQEALEAILAELPAREKTILRLHYVEGLNIDAIGRTYGVHRATVARWLLGIRGTIVAKICERLATRFPSTTSEVRGVLTALRSELYISISRVLATG